MKDIIIQKIQHLIDLALDKAADDYINKNISETPTIEDYQKLLTKVKENGVD